MKAAIYCRVSTQDQQDQGTSLDSQLEACLTKAKELGYETSEDYTIREAYSGLTLDRPKLNDVRQWVRDKEVDAVIAYTLDRLSRDPVHFIILQEELERTGIELILVTEDLDSSDSGKLITHIKGYAAKLEALKIRERTLRGLKERAKSGKLVGGRSVHLYGYSYEKEHGKRIINEQQAQLVRTMFRWLAEGSTINGITYQLIDMGIPTPTGKSRWNRSTVHKILTNPSYIGKPKPYHGISIVDSTPPLISEELFNQVLTRLKQNEQGARRNAKVEYLLRGHIFCSRCQRRYYACKMHRKVRYYYCSGRLRILTSNKCDNKSYQADYLENIVWERVRELLTRPETILAELERRKHEGNQADLTKELSDIEKRLTDLDRQQEELLGWALKGFPEEAIVGENLKINQYRDSLKSRLSELSTRMAEVEQAELDLPGVKHFCELASENLTNFTYADKRLALETLRIEAWINGEDILIKGAIPAYDLASTQLKLGHQE